MPGKGPLGEKFGALTYNRLPRGLPRLNWGVVSGAVKHDKEGM